MKLSDRICISGILILSFVGSIIGARIGRRKAVSDKT
jgi:hypothetical protein